MLAFFSEYVVFLKQTNVRPRRLSRNAERRLVRARRLVNFLLAPLYGVSFVSAPATFEPYINLASVAILGARTTPPLDALTWGSTVVFCIATPCLVMLLLVRARIRTAMAGHIAAPKEEPGIFSLYLRSFFIDETLKSGTLSFFPDPRNEESLELRLERFEGPQNSLVKIGSRSLFDLSGGTHRPSVTDDEQWLVDMQRLSLVARRIYMTPILLRLKSGTGRELEFLTSCDGLEGRTQYIMPPNKRLTVLARGMRIRTSVRELWQKSRKMCASEFKLDLPAYTREGAVLVRSASGLIPVSGILGRDWHHPKSLRFLYGSQKLPASRWLDAWYFALHSVRQTLFLPVFVGLFAGLAMGDRAANGEFQFNQLASVVVYLLAATLFATYPLYRVTGLYVTGIWKRALLHGSFVAAVSLALLALDFIGAAALRPLGDSVGHSAAQGIVAVGMVVLFPVSMVALVSRLAFEFVEPNSQLVRVARAS